MTVTRRTPENAALLAFPMHGQHKLLEEGYRTRDGHLIEWFGRQLRDRGPVAVVSRPEPLVAELARRADYSKIARNTVGVRTPTARIPNLRDRRKWWVDSLSAYPREFPSASTPAVVWNPFVSLSSSAPALFAGDRKIAFDLLDDWTIHFAFQSIGEEVDRAYRAMFDRADSVTANAEGTLELAHRYGRSDAVMIPNGCDPQRFSTSSRAQGPMKVGYVGKIGKRLDLDLIVNAARALPDATFILAGPILDAEYRKPLAAFENIELRGDVHYERVPDLLTEFDIGWVPHNVGAGEVGGDVIKTYEYRAAGLPVLTTPIGGVEKRGLSEVHIRPSDQHIAWLKGALQTGPRVPRVPGTIPLESHWETKATRILKSLELEGPTG